jgi:tRNA(fMet)-specific endonuclease VapC
MTVFDTNILSGLFVPAVAARVAAVPVAEQYVPIVVAEEALRGQLATVRAAQAGRGKISVEKAYLYLEETLRALQSFQLLPYTAAADALVRSWQATKIRVGTQDLRIAAICFAHGAKLATRNARDFAQIPGLNLEVWT